MFRVELYKESRLLEAKTEQTERGALMVIDVMITAVHHGQHGTGEFRVAADQINDIGMFQNSLFDSDTFPHPMKSRAA
jgi:hypothetical protein